MSADGGGGPREPRPRDLLLTLGVALVVVGIAAVIAAFVRGEPEDGALASLMAAGGAVLWHRRRSKLG